MTKLSRRRWLKASGVGGAAIVAGCSDETTDISPEKEQPINDASTRMDGDTAPLCEKINATLDNDTIFRHGIASGDPLADAVILWTRVSGQEGKAGDVEVHWELSEFPDMSVISHCDVAYTSDSIDFTVKVDAKELKENTTYYYRFYVGDVMSKTARTKTLPVGKVDNFRIGIVSCANLGHGYFHAYRHLAENNNVDLILHLGDYIYEYESGHDWSGKGVPLRPVEPKHECLTLDDYRQRYAFYHREEELLLLHQRHPMIAIWDDHEFANDAYMGGAENHNPGEGSWADRRAGATQAYFEWMPIRETEEYGRIFRGFEIGNLAQLDMLDTRIWGREKQNGSKAGAKGRQLLGEDQETWLKERIDKSEATWNLLGQQVLMAQIRTKLLDDTWDGYEEARLRVLNILGSKIRANNVVLTGDLHSSWAVNLSRDPFRPINPVGENKDSPPVAVEFACPSVTSEGLQGINNKFANLLRPIHKHVKFVDVESRGYMVLDVTPERVQNDFYFVDRAAYADGGQQRFRKAFTVTKGTNRLSETNAPIGERSDKRAEFPPE